MAKKITHDDFIKSIKQVHGNSYDYRKTTYVNRRTKVILTCFLHGDFEKTPTELAQGSGCQKCSRHARSLLAEKLSTETLKTRKKSFLEKAKAVHANKYDYSKVRYTNSASKVTVICPAHGEFRQAANSHLQGRGCKQCYLEDLGKDKMLPHREVINRLHKNHGEKYNYSKVNYTGISKPITLVCSKHGDFEILASQAFLGSGCQQCSIEARRKSNKDFVDEITAIFGAKYDFSEVNYFNTETRVKVICKNHGSWLSYPSSLLQGHGCRSCGDEKRALGRTKSTSDFIKEAVALHGNKYNYQRSEYIKSDVHVEIICSIHGAFHQSPHSHLKGSGCLQCGFESTHSSLKISKDEFIQRAAEVHGNRYDYNNIEYEGLKALVTLTCKIHGKFNLYPRAHLNGQYCTKCRVEERHNRFIKEAKSRHNNNFDYSKTKYISITDDIIIICKVHGEYKYPAGSHLYSKHGCPMCARDSINSSLIDRLALTTESFIEKAREIHGSRYDYDSVEYLGSKKKVKIRCRKHSFFNQRPNDHLTGSGCQKCKMSKGELLLGKYLRKWNIPYESEFKIAACKNINPLPFDFAIFSLEKKLIGLVEYHGLQHKVPIDFFGGEKSFVRRKIHDKIKEDYCETHNIPLHIVWTDDVDKLKKLERFIETLQT